MKINNRIENIFTQAASLGNCGRFKTTIHCIKDSIYLLNSDNTVLLKFSLRKGESPFSNPICFSYSDYDSRKFYEENGKIIFESERGEYLRKKICGQSLDINVEEIWLKFNRSINNFFIFDKNLIALLDPDLSHVEFSVSNGNFKLVQRDIYSGSVIEITEPNKGLGLKAKTSNIQSFDPIGLRTSDFLALFSLSSAIYFKFKKGLDYSIISNVDPPYLMEGIIAHCVYDELGIVEEVKPNGREVQKNWRGQQEINSKASENATGSKIKRFNRCQ